jgi:hypothetical protein
MEWIAGAALLPLLMCGLMCIGGIALAALGLRRTQSTDRPCCDHHSNDEHAAASDRPEVQV